MIETIKDIAAVIGCILSATTLITLVIKPIRQRFIGFIRSKTNAPENERQISELKQMLEAHITSDAEFKQALLSDLDLQKEFAKMELRNMIKNIYYRYCEEEALPEYELKTLMLAYEMYHDRYGGNSFVTKLYGIMMEWDVISHNED